MKGHREQFDLLCNLNSNYTKLLPDVISWTKTECMVSLLSQPAVAFAFNWSITFTYIVQDALPSVLTC